MNAGDIADARDRWAEQLGSDERVLGAVPEEAAGLLLAHGLARLDAAAAVAGSVEDLDAAAESIRAEMRRLADEAAAADDAHAFLLTTLGGAPPAPPAEPDAERVSHAPAGAPPAPQDVSVTAPAGTPSAPAPPPATTDEPAPRPEPEVVAAENRPAGSVWHRLRRRLRRWW